MVDVQFRIICEDLTGGFRGGLCTVPEGTNIACALDACLEENGVEFAGDRDYLTICLRNGRRALWADEVTSGDEICVLRKVVGG